jgi:pimeloyl-ACP methyl ester carboxylesterase
MTAPAATDEIVTRTLEVPGATLAYDIRENSSSAETPLLLIGTPMGAGGFVSLASHFGDRTVITYDPRGTERSTLADPATPINPKIHAEDVHRVIEATGLGPVDVFASSGGAVNALELAAHYPQDVRTVVAHEPPLASQVADREYAEAACLAIHETYMARGTNAGMAHFMAVVMHQGEFTPDFLAQPAPDPQMFGMPAEDDGDRSDAMLGNYMVSQTSYEPDYDALRAFPGRLIIAAGGDSHGELAQRAALAVADRLGAETMLFPGDHGGFLGGEYGQTGKPEEFAAKLREVLDES